MSNKPISIEDWEDKVLTFIVRAAYIVGSSIANAALVYCFWYGWYYTKNELHQIVFVFSVLATAASWLVIFWLYGNDVYAFILRATYRAYLCSLKWRRQ